MEKTAEKNKEYTIEYYKERNEELEAKLKWYEEQFRLLQKQKYGASSEKTNEDQLSLPLFNEARIQLIQKLKSLRLIQLHIHVKRNEKLVKS